MLAVKTFYGNLSAPLMRELLARLKSRSTNCESLYFMSNQSINQSGNESISQAIKQSIGQSVNQYINLLVLSASYAVQILDWSVPYAGIGHITFSRAISTIWPKKFAPLWRKPSRTRQKPFRPSTGVTSRPHSKWSLTTFSTTKSSHSSIRKSFTNRKARSTPTWLPWGSRRRLTAWMWRVPCFLWPLRRCLNFPRKRHRCSSWFVSQKHSRRSRYADEISRGKRVRERGHWKNVSNYRCKSINQSRDAKTCLSLFNQSINQSVERLRSSLVAYHEW